jgi:branched-chain amino acid transport system permease protein
VIAPTATKPARTSVLSRSEVRRRYSDPRRMLVIAVGAAIAAVVVGLIPEYQTYTLGLVALYILPTFGLRVLVGMTGQLSIAQGAFVGIGAYTYGILVVRHSVDPLLAIVCSVLISAVLGALLAFPASRVSGFYLALVTLGFQYIFEQVVSQFPDFTGGSSGISIPPLKIFGSIMTPLNIVDTAIVLVAVVWWLGLQFASSRYGHAMIAVRDNENAAAAAGISIRRYKVLAFTISAACASLAGPFIAITVGYVDPTQYAFLLSVQFLVAVFIGGTEGWLGIGIATFVVFGMPHYLNGLSTYQEVIFNGLLLVIVLVYPRGLTGPISYAQVWLGRGVNALRRRRHSAAGADR